MFVKNSTNGLYLTLLTGIWWEGSQQTKCFTFDDSAIIAA
jgi:hypothetical protein